MNGYFAARSRAGQLLDFSEFIWQPAARW